MLGQAVFLQGSRVWLSHSSVALHHTDVRSPGEYCLRALTLSLAQESMRQQWEALCSLIAFAAQVNRRVRHYMHHSTNLALFDHAVGREQKVKVHPLLLASLKQWLRVQDWLKPDKFFTP